MSAQTNDMHLRFGQRASVSSHQFRTKAFLVVLTQVNVFAFYDGFSDMLPACGKTCYGTRNVILLEHAGDELRDSDGTQRCAG